MVQINCGMLSLYLVIRMHFSFKTLEVVLIYATWGKWLQFNEKLLKYSPNQTLVMEIDWNVHPLTNMIRTLIGD